MRVALFHGLPPGGARRAMYELTRRLPHSIDVFTLDLGAADRWPGLADQYSLEDQTDGHHVLRVPLPGITGNYRRVLAAEASVVAQRWIARRIDGGRYDVAVVHNEQFMSGPSLLERVHTPTIFYCHEPRRRSFEYLARTDGPRGALGVAARLYESSVKARDIRWARAADLIVANSAFSAESILRAYGRTATVSHLGVDTDAFALEEGARGGGVLAVGALDRLKGHTELLDAVGRIPTVRRPPITIVYERSDHHYERQLVAKSSDLGIELRLLRDLPEEALVGAYQRADVTACCAYLEPFGLTAIESMSCGTPVVAVREGGYPESVGGGGGLCVERNPDVMADAIDRIVSGRAVFDPGAVRATVEPYWTWDAAAERFDAIIRRYA